MSRSLQNLSVVPEEVYANKVIRIVSDLVIINSAMCAFEQLSQLWKALVRMAYDVLAVMKRSLEWQALLRL